MQSVTQAAITKDEIYTVIKHHFGENITIGKVDELTEGFYSVAYSIVLPSLDHDVILKLEPPSNENKLTYERNALEIEVKSMELLASNLIGETLPLPELLYHDIKGNLIGRGYFITKKFRGTPWNRFKKEMSDNEKKKVDYNIGEIQSRMNMIEGESFGLIIDDPDYPTRADTWAESFGLMVENLFHDAQKFHAKLPMTPEKIRSLLVQSEFALNEVQTPYFIHWDLWEGNVFLLRENGDIKVEGIIDFERAMWGDPLMEVLFRNKKKRIEFIRGYGKNLLEGEGAKIRDYWYEIYLSLIILIESNARQYKPRLKIFFLIFAKAKYKYAMKNLQKILNNRR